MTVHRVCRLLLLSLLVMLCIGLAVPGQTQAAPPVTATVGPGITAGAGSTSATGSTTGGAGVSGSTAVSGIAGTGGLLIRVALDEGVSSASFSVTQGSYTLTDGTTGVPLGMASPGSTWSVTAAGTTMQVQQPGSVSLQPFQGPIVLQDIGGASAAQPSLFCYNGVQYRGSLVIRSLNNNLLVLNVLNMESYLYGVVGEEMGGGASAEAYCAQAVASRSYALSMRGNSPWYDVGSGTGAQAYGGYTAEQEFACNGDNPVVDAVQRTSGQVLEYAGALVTAYFHANAGGYTEDMENVWAGSRPYLKGVQSDGDAYADKLGGGAQSDYTWTKTCDRSDLGTQLGVGRVLDIQVSRNRTQVSTDPVSGRVTMNLVPGTTTVSGRVTQVTVVGTDGTKTYYRDAIRQALGLKSTLFDVSMGGQLEALDSQGQNDALSGSEVTALGKDGTPQSVPLRTGSLYVIGSGSRLVAQGASTDEITFSGRGYGHGVGMSQVGAIGMAVEGYKYMDILELYYDQGKQDGNLQIVGNYGN